MFGDQRERRAGLNIAGDHQHGIVGLIVIAVERLQPVDRHVFDIGTVADGGAAIVVPLIGGARHFLRQHAADIVFAGFKFVAYHRHFAVQIGARNERVDHAVGFELKRPLQIDRIGRKRQEVVGPVEVGGAVPAGAARGELGLDIFVFRRALEHQMLQQVRHARFAVTLMAGADQVRNVGGDEGLRGIFDQQHFEAIGKAVFLDTPHFRAGRDAGWQRDLRARQR